MPTRKRRTVEGQKESPTGPRTRGRAAPTLHTAGGTGRTVEGSGSQKGEALSAGKEGAQAPSRPDRYAPNPDVYGSARGVLTMAPDFDEPLDDFGDLS